MSLYGPKLTSYGRIPAHTECPYKNRCKMNHGCHHHGKDHTVEFSCGLSRAFAICDTNQTKLEGD